MLLIAHRGNLEGPNPEKENGPSYIKRALDLGYDVEIDVWYLNGSFYLGHDGPTKRVSSAFVAQEGLWCHAKNGAALNHLLDVGAHCFAHDKDPAALTSLGYIWAFPHLSCPTMRSIAVLPEIFNTGNETEFYGICTDFVKAYEAENLRNMSCGSL